MGHGKITFREKNHCNQCTVMGQKLTKSHVWYSIIVEKVMCQKSKVMCQKSKVMCQEDRFKFHGNFIEASQETEDSAHFIATEDSVVLSTFQEVAPVSTKSVKNF